MFVYIIYSSSADSFYKGITKDIAERMNRHNLGYEKSTKSGTPWKLLWFTAKSTKSEAVKLEKKLKNLSRTQTCDFMIKHSSNVASPDEMLMIEHLSGR